MSQDKWGRDYATLLSLQQTQLAAWRTLLRPDVHAELVATCRAINRPALPSEVEAYASLKVYRAGALHSCPVGAELVNVLLDKHQFLEERERMLRSTTVVVQTAVTKQRQTHMKQLASKFAALAALYTEIADLMSNAPESSSTATDPKEALKELAAKKEEALVTKILKKKFAADSIDELEDGDIEKATTLIGELDDAEGAEAEPAPKAKGGKVTMDMLKDLAHEILTDGKAEELKKVSAKFKAKKISEIAEKDWAAAHAELTKLK